MEQISEVKEKPFYVVFKYLSRILLYPPSPPPQSRQSTRLFLQVVRIGTLPPPHPQASVPHPLWFRRGGIHSLGGDGVWGPNSDEWTDTVVLLMYEYVLNFETTALFPS